MNTTQKQNKATFGQALQVLTFVNQKGADAKKLDKLFQSGLFSDLLESDLKTISRDSFRHLLGLLPVAIPLQVDYSRSLKRKHDELVAAGVLDTSLDDGDRIRRVKHSDSVIAELVSFDRPIRTDDVRKVLRRRQLRPATGDELLAFASVYGHKKDQ